MKVLNTKSPARIFKVLSSDSGVRIFSLLGAKRRICVSDVSKAVGLSLSATSHQLQKMEAAGLVSPIRTGRSICYVLNQTPQNGQLLKCVKQLSPSLKGRST